MDALDRLIEREGGYVDHPADRGGPTKWGITLDTLRWYRNNFNLKAADVHALTYEEARAIYERRYWTGPRIAEIGDRELRELMLDAAVHHGSRRAARWMQTALGVTVDGVIGAETLTALSRRDPKEIKRAVLRQRLIFVGQLISQDPAQAVFAHGWLRRIAGFI